MFENHTAGERVEGAEAVRAHIGGIFERWPSLRFRGRSFYAADDFAVSEWTATATRPDGVEIEWDGVDVFPLPRRQDRAQGRLLVLACATHHGVIARRQPLRRKDTADLEPAAAIAACLEACRPLP